MVLFSRLSSSAGQSDGFVWKTLPRKNRRSGVRIPPEARPGTSSLSPLDTRPRHPLQCVSLLSAMGLKYTFNTAQPLTPALSEFIGAVIGDGCMSTNRRQVFLTGDSEKDRTYYETVIAPYCQRIFGFSPSIYVRKDVPRAIILQISSKAVFDFLHDRFSIRPNKTHTVRIPDEIIAKPKMTVACLRGLFDTTEAWDSTADLRTANRTFA